MKKTIIILFSMAVALGCVVYLVDKSTEQKDIKTSEKQVQLIGDLRFAGSTSKDQFFEMVDNKVKFVAFAAHEIPSIHARQQWLEQLSCLPEYAKNQLDKARGKTFHVILQMHTDPRFPNLKGVRESQDKLYAYLNMTKPSLVGIEGAYLDRFTPFDFIQECNESLRQVREITSGMGVGNFGIDDLNALSNQDLVIKYALENPTTICVGSEWRGVHTLDAVFMSYNQPKFQVPFIECSALRSVNTIARLNEIMDTHGLTECALVIGLGHKDDFAVMSKLFGFTIEFVETI